jgi:MerR family transcriptional regulator, light-induced transcriptional regulator
VGAGSRVTVSREMANPPKQDPREPGEEQVRQLAEAYLSAMLSADLAAAERTIRDAHDADLTPAEVYERVIGPGLWRIGELWERGEISVADEHAATEISLHVLALQREAHRVARARSGYKVILATPAGELHVVALRMVRSLLAAAGYQTLMLGAGVPADALEDAARRHQPDAICLSATIRGLTEHLLSCVDRVQADRPSTGFVLGGHGITVEGQLRHSIHVCSRVSEAVEAVDAIVKHARSN